MKTKQKEIKVSEKGKHVNNINKKKVNNKKPEEKIFPETFRNRIEKNLIAKKKKKKTRQ